MTIADLDTLAGTVKLSTICRDAGVMYVTIMGRISRYRRGESYAELTPGEVDALTTALDSLRERITEATERTETAR